ncbi:histidine phosphatase family protein (plasmid) [Radiobacillus kanasensis]|uniref:histidine phosphatase family protein n=1 Tax=Radiobacillus kanasensis TaxID=2844358 RepID=UPI001E44209E|nr:histidine phosphatase family protein [Radiobacillus kanasensis]UFU01530.1 histidine phosphatase family protein [Radiobacillus kanasensis]
MQMIGLVRHGETDWNVAGKLQGKTDVPLNERGIAQAKACKEHFKHEDWDLLVSSPLKRAKKTAEIINEALQLPFYEMEDFKERSFGEAEGLLAEERNSLYPNRDYPGAESFEAFQARVMNGLSLLNSKYPNKRILLVAHGAVIGCILSILSKGTLNSKNTRLHNAGWSRIQYIDDAWQVHDVNQVNHLTNL